MAATELFPMTGDQPFFSARRAFAITLHNSNEIAYVTKGLFVGTGGNLKVTMYDGTAVTFSNVPSGTILPIMVKIVWSTGSTASNVVGLA